MKWRFPRKHAELYEGRVGHTTVRNSVDLFKEHEMDWKCKSMS